MLQANQSKATNGGLSWHVPPDAEGKHAFYVWYHAYLGHAWGNTRQELNDTTNGR